MHVLSKVLLGVVILAAVVAVVLTSKLRLARGHWLEQVAQRQTQLETSKEDLRKKQLTVAAARDDVNRLMSLWGNSWDSAQNQLVNPQQGAVATKVGGNAGVARREFSAQSQLPAYYLFAVAPQGQESKYLGEFRATAVQADQTALQLTRAPYPGEAQSWPQGPWRIRESIPSHWRAIFSGLQAKTAEALQDVQDQQARLAMAENLNAKSQQQLQRRLQQLEGNPDAVPGASSIVLDGLVKSLRAAETARNQDLARLDDLRHEYDQKYRRLAELLEQNRQLERSLPQPADSSTPVDGQQAEGAGAQSSALR